MCNTKNIIPKRVLSIILKGKMEKKIKLFYPQGKFYSIPSFWILKAEFWMMVIKSILYLQTEQGS